VPKKCGVSDCICNVKAKGLCQKHYVRLIKHGDTNTVLPPSGPSVRFLHIDDKKRCGSCEQYRPLEEFSKNINTWDGLCTRCKSCSYVERQSWAENNRDYCRQHTKKFNEKKPEYAEEYKLSVKGRYSLLKSHAKMTGRLCTITFEEYAIILRFGVCSYCGGALSKSGHSLDRIDSSQGYVLSNVAVCCGVCNYMKQDLSLEEFKQQILKIAINRRWFVELPVAKEIKNVA
jgi:hypothetical protein